MFQSILSLFFPEICAGCHAILPTYEKVVCATCRHELPLTYHHLNPENEAFKKFYGKVPVEFAVAYAYFHKTGVMRNLIHSLKYQANEPVGAQIGYWFAEDLKTLTKLQPIDQIVPVPLHPKKQRQRGYNQVSAFGRSLSDELNIPLNENVLKRVVYSKTQTKKNLFHRTDLQKRTIFEAVSNPNHYNQHFLLIDDVLTTGSTLEACSKALLEIPGARVSIACMAMSH